MTQRVPTATHEIRTDSNSVWARCGHEIRNERSLSIVLSAGLGLSGGRDRRRSGDLTLFRSSQDVFRFGSSHHPSLAIAATAYVVFSVALPSAENLKCGATDIRSVGVARPFYNTTELEVIKQCQG